MWRINPMIEEHQKKNKRLEKGNEIFKNSVAQDKTNYWCPLHVLRRRHRRWRAHALRCSAKPHKFDLVA